jgi:hypothetical protein
MKLRLKELDGILEGLNRVKFKMPTKTGYWLGIWTKKAKDHADTYSEKMSDLLERYGEKDADNKFIMANERSIKLKDPSAYNKEVRDLGNEEIDILFRPMPMEAFYPKEKVKEGKEEVEPFCTLEDMEVLSRFMIPLEEE